MKHPENLEWSIHWKLSQPLKVKNPEEKGAHLFVGNDVAFSVQIAESDKNRLMVNHMTYSFADRDFIMRRKSTGKEKYELVANPSKDFRFKRTPGRVWDLPAKIGVKIGVRSIFLA